MNLFWFTTDYNLFLFEDLQVPNEGKDKYNISMRLI